MSFSRLPFAAIIVVILAAAIAVAGFLDSGDVKTQPVAEAAAEPKDPCEEARESCASVQLRGREWRYSVVRATTDTKRTVILDLGGPGIAPLSGTYHLDGYAKQVPQLGGYNMLVIEEPWVTQSLDDSCAAAGTKYYESVRAGAQDVTDQAAALHEKCRIGQGRWGFTPQDYADVVSTVIAKESLEVEGFIGHSFGVARYSYLVGAEATRDLRWSVLARPFPIGVDAASFASRRTELIEKSFGQTPRVFSQASAPSRSLPVTKFDVASAIVGLSYAAESEKGEAAEAVTKDHDPEVVGRFSDNIWHRYGTNSVSPAFLAQLDEICSATTSSEKLKAGLSRDAASQIVAKLMLPCAGEPSRKLSLPKTTTCVISSDTDPVVAGGTAATLVKRVVPGAVVYKSRVASHRSQDGLSFCLKQVLKAR
ncbi:hypothetical protein AB0C12_10685 [Actinoplanes sp. NPDC048967]|uniref:hypothetical protein n=1 Tax=Actinoplanes sp. NPDC048967 TaxID=3155269 RepID=UPI0033C70D07